MLKKIFIIILVILLLAAGIGAYFFFFSNKKTDTTGQGITLQDFFPFGDSGNSKTPIQTEPVPVDNEPDAGTPTNGAKPPKLQMVNKGPIAGAYVYDVLRELPRDPLAIGKDGKPLPIQTEPATMVRYSEVATGHTDETYLDALNVRKITNTTIPKITESFFAGKGGAVSILRYADDSKTIQTFSGNIPLLPKADGTLDTNLKGTYLTENIVSMAVSPDRQKIFTIAKNDTGSVGTVSLPDGTKKSQLFSLSFSEWLSEWPNQKFVTLTTKPSANVHGYLYTIDTTSKVMKKSIGGVNGLTTLTSPDMKTILFSRSSNNNVTSSLYDTASKNVLSLPGGATLPEKCVWQSVTILYCAVPSYIANGDYPDIWYQGGVSFVDQIYKINIKDFSTTVIANPASVNASIDAINLSVDPSNTFLIFTNKRDGSLWSLDLRPDPVTTDSVSSETKTP